MQGQLLKLGYPGGNPALVIDKGGHSVIGAANHPASCLQGAHPGHLQMLQWPDRLAEPAVVTDGDQQLAACGQSRGKVRVDGFVADEGGQGIIPHP